MATTTELKVASLDDVFQARLPTSKLRLRGASPPPTLPPYLDLVQLLGPGDALTSSLIDFTTTYTGINQAFNQLLLQPYMDQVIANDAKTGLRIVLVDANSKFQVYASQEVSAARNLISLAQIIPTLLADRPIADFVHAYSEILAQYAKNVDENARVKRADFEKLLPTLNQVYKNFNTTSSQLLQFSQDLKLKKKSLQGKNIVQCLRTMLGSTYRLSEQDDDAQVQLGVLLAVSGNTLDGTIGDLFRSSGATRSIVLRAGIDQIAHRLTSITPSLSTLANTLGPSLSAAEAIAAIWDHISDNVQTLNEVDIIPNPELVNEIGLKWKATAAQCERLVSAIQSTPLAVASEFAAEAPYQLSLPLPESKPYLEAMKAANKLEGDPYIITNRRVALQRSIARSKPVRERLIEKAIARIKTEREIRVVNGTSTAEVAALEVLDESEFLQDFGPPDSTSSSLDQLAGDCLIVMARFDAILQLPYLDSLQVDNPFRTVPFKSDAVSESEQEPEKIDIRTMVIRYKNKYDELQQSSVGLIRDLITYSTLQQMYLPKVTVSETPASDQISLKSYLDINLKLVAEYSTRTNTLHETYLKFQQNWHLAQINLGKAINTAKDDIETNKKNIINLKEEQKKDTLYGILGTIGALALFTVGAFTLPLGILALGGGAVLLTWSISELEKAGKLDEAIATYAQSLVTAKETQANLKLIEDPMQKVADAIINITNVFFELSKKLSLIKTNMTIWESSPSIFTSTAPMVITAWQEVSAQCDRYVNIISGGS